MMRLARRWWPRALLILAILIWAPRTWSQGEAPVEEGEEEIEEIEEVSDLGGGGVAHGAPAARPGLLARLHPLVVHFPIAWVFLLVLVEGIALVWGRPGWWGSAGLPLLLLTVISAIPTVITGFARAAASSDPADLGLIAQHRNAALGATLLLAGALILRFKAHRPLSRPLRLIYLLLLGGIALLISVVGYLGGELMFGVGHLFP